jgi:hypothetical protein
MNPFLLQFIQRTPQVLRSVQGFGAKAAPKAVKGIVDTVTNPQTYRRLAASAENTLQQALPKTFAGPNFGSIPARFTGLISDVAQMPAGLARDVQSGMVGRAIQEAAGFAPQLSRGVSQAATGALRAPVIGDALRTGQSVLTSPLQTAIQTGGQFARDPGLRREFLKQFGGTSEKAARALSGATDVGRVGGLLQRLSPGGATGLRGSLALPGALGGAAWALADPTPLIEASHWLGDRLSDAGIGGYDPRKDYSRITPIQYRSVVNPGELAPDYSGAADRAARFTQYANMGQELQDASLTPGATPPNQPAPPASQSPAPRGFVEQQAGQPSLPPPPGDMLGQVVLSNGAGVPAQRQNVQNRALSQEVLNAAQQYSAPAGIPLPSFYEGQQQLGRSMTQTGELQRRLTDLGAAPDMEQEALKTWVRTNPGLAYRELMKLQRGQ